jgi:protein-histidine pros-kinase
LQRLSHLRQAVGDNIRSAEALLEVRKKRGVAAAMHAFLEADSSQEMNRIRAMIRDMGDEERRLLKQREDRLQASDRVMTPALRAWRFLVLALLLINYFLFSRDARQRHALEQELLRKNAELEEANRLKSEFLANMSHELRTPLNAVIGYTGTLLMRLPGPLTADQEKQLKTVQTSARHLLSLINDLLDLAKIESGKIDVKLEEISCREIIEQIISTVRPIAQAKSLSLEAALPSGAVVAKTDRRAISQILINLTNNGIKYTDKGSVRLELSENVNGGHAMAAIDVVDTGPGIRPEDQTRLFRAFEQLGTARPREGTGLGLFVSGRLAALIGARIEFASELGKGSRFTVLIPKA